MRKYKVRVSEKYCYYIDADAENKEEAIRKGEKIYNEADGSDGYIGLADAQSFEGYKMTAKLNK